MKHKIDLHSGRGSRIGVGWGGVGVVGLGHGRSHLHAFQAHAGSRVIAVADRKNERDVAISPSATIKGFAWLPSLRRGGLHVRP